MSIATLGVTAVVLFSSNPVTVALPAIGGDLGHIRLLPWVLSAYVLGSAVGLLAAGAVIDSFGVRRTFQACVLWYVTTTALCAIAPSAVALVSARLLQGVGSGFAQASAFAAIAVAYPPELRPRMFAANSTLWGVAGLVAPTLGSVVVTTLGWRWLFGLNVPVAIAAASLGWRVLPGRVSSAPGLRLDRVGITMLGFGTGALLVAFGALDRTALLALGIAVVLGAAYWRHSSRALDPVLPRRAIVSTPFRWLDLTGLLAFTIPWGLSAYGALLVVAGRGGGSAEAAAVVTSTSIGWIGGSVVAGVLWRGRDLGRLLQGGCALMAVGAGAGGLAWSAGGSPVLLVLVGLVTGLGGGLTNNVSLNLTQAYATIGEVGRTLSAFQFVRNFGSAAGAAITGAVIFGVVAARMGSIDRLRDALEPGAIASGSELASAVRSGSQVAHVVAAVFGVVAIVAAGRLRRWQADDDRRTEDAIDGHGIEPSDRRSLADKEEVLMSRVVAVIGSPVAGSRTLTVAEEVARRLAEVRVGDEEVKVESVDLALYAVELFDWSSHAVACAVDRVRHCEVLVVASPVDKASDTGLLKAFLDRFPNDGLSGVVAVPVMVGATPRHSLAVDLQLRPVLQALGASCPTHGLFLTEAELTDLSEIVDAWCDGELPKLPIR